MSKKLELIQRLYDTILYIDTEFDLPSKEVSWNNDLMDEVAVHILKTEGGVDEHNEIYERVVNKRPTMTEEEAIKDLICRINNVKQYLDIE